MLQVLKALEKEPVGILHLRKAVPRWCKVLHYDGLPTRGTLKQVMGTRYRAIIVFYNMHDTKMRKLDGMGHYVAILRHKTQIEYFSSYGLQVSAEVSATHSDPNRLKRLLGPKVQVNKVRLQDKYHTNTCGRWALARVLLADVPLKAFIKVFSQKIQLTRPDDIVSLATFLNIR